MMDMSLDEYIETLPGNQKRYYKSLPTCTDDRDDYDESNAFYITCKPKVITSNEMDKNLFMMVWKAVGPEITKYHTYRLEDYIKYNQTNVNRITLGLQLFDRCADRFCAWSFACKYDCRQLVDFLKKYPINMTSQEYSDLLREIAKNGRTEYIDIVPGLDRYVRSIKSIAIRVIEMGTLRSLYERCGGGIYNKYTRILEPATLTYQDMKLLDGLGIHYKLNFTTPDRIHILKSHIDDNPLNAAYICALAGDNISFILKNHVLTNNSLFLKVLVKRRSVEDLKTLLDSRHGALVDGDVLLKYALLDGHLDTIKFLCDGRKNISIPLEGKINGKKYELAAIKFLKDKYNTMFTKYKHLTRFLENDRYDILEYYYDEYPIMFSAAFAGSSGINLTVDQLKWLQNKGVYSTRVFINFLISHPFDENDIISYLKNNRIKTISLAHVYLLLDKPYKFNLFMNYFTALKSKKNSMLEVINNIERLLPRHTIILEVLLVLSSILDKETYARILRLILDLPYEYDNRERNIVQQYVIDHSIK